FGGRVLSGVAFREPDPGAAVEAQLSIRRKRRPFRMRREMLPRVLSEQLLAKPDLPRALQVHCLIPGDFAVTNTVLGTIRGRTMRLSATVALPDAIGAVGVAGRAVHHTNPEHRPRPFGGDSIHQHFVTCFAVDHRHDRLVGVRLADGSNCWW